ncbi:MAG: ferritin family protein [Planctomycetota bacterium]|jgi:rubrerythrin
MPNTADDAVAAIDAAMEAEMSAAKFYRDAVEKTSSTRGQDMLRQLAMFEDNHFEKLQELRTSLAGGGAYIVYEGTDLASMTSEIPGEVDEGKEGNLDAVLDILRAAIESETEAYKRYQTMAKDTVNPEGKVMFLKLAKEEILHRRILSDEFYHLANMGGAWSWGD